MTDEQLNRITKNNGVRHFSDLEVGDYFIPMPCYPFDLIDGVPVQRKLGINVASGPWLRQLYDQTSQVIKIATPPEAKPC